METEQRCETCKWYQRYLSDSSDHMICRNQEVCAEMMSLFTPPSPDFGCNLWEANHESAKGN